MPTGLELLYAAVIITFLAVFLFMLVYAGTATLTALNTVPGFTQHILVPGPANTVVNSTQTPYSATSGIINYYYLFDDFLPFLFFVVSLGIIAGVLLVASDTLGLVIGFVIQIITVFVSVVWSNSMRTVFTNPVFISVAPKFPNTITLIAKLPFYEVIFTFILLIAIVAKMRGFGFGGGSTYSGARL